MAGVVRWLRQKIHSSSPGMTFTKEFARRGTQDFVYIRIAVPSIPTTPEIEVNDTPVTIVPINSVERFGMLENDAGNPLPQGDGLQAYSQAAKLEILLFGLGSLLSPTVRTFYATPAADI